jgi:hypothetical protein
LFMCDADAGERGTPPPFYDHSLRLGRSSQFVE